MLQETTNEDLDLVEEIDAYLKRLFPLCRSITGEPNRETLRILQEIIPLTINEVPTGTKVFDWIIPEEWRIDNAWIEDSKGRRIVDFQKNNLHIVNYSAPIEKLMDWEELKPHIHKHPKLPHAIPYRTSYYERDWGFCVTHSQYDELAEAEKQLYVKISSEFKRGSLTYGEILISGRSKREILLTCYICHPSMANDSLSGILLTSFLAQNLLKMKDLHWSYRIIFVPETIGAIAYCSANESALKQIDMGLVITTVGGSGLFGFKKSWNSNHHLNLLIERVFKSLNLDYLTYPFDIHGSDERQFSSLGFRINMATISRDKYYEYDYYHTSLDDLEYVNSKNISETLDVYIKLIEYIEAMVIYENKSPNCEIMLSKHNLYPKQGGALIPESKARTELDIILWLLFLCDGKRPIENIAEELNINVYDLNPVIDKLKQKSLIGEI
ncbi:MAG: DUF4910 domain-containing protein [Bacteroidetes bacterium]|nr:DUF4910 domain-containing protein [Bacteroidota bacterium]